MANFLTLRKDVMEYLGDTSSTTETLVGNEINEAITELLNRSLWRFAVRQTTITTTSGVADYYFPSDFDKTISLTQREDDVQLSRVFIADFERLVPDPTNMYGAGRPKCYMELLDDRVLAQPSATAKVTLVSDSNSDLTYPKATVFGVSGGVDRTELVSLSAQNFVSTVGTFSKLYSITLNLSCVGTVAAYQATAGTNLLKIYPGELERAYRKFKLWPTPDGSYTIYLTYQAVGLPLVNDSDTPIIPSKYHDVIKEMVISRLLTKQGDVKAAYFIQSAEKKIKEMMSSEDLTWDYTPMVKGLTSGYYYDPSYPFSLSL